MQGARRTSWLLVLILLGCGGVSRNPSEPTIQGPGSRPPTQGPGATGAGGGDVAPEADPFMANASTPEEYQLAATAQLIQANLESGANGYTLAHQKDPAEPEYALGAAITVLWRDMELFAGLTGPQLAQSFYNTPLGLAPLALPQPLAEEDGYFRRLLAASVDSQPPLDPAALLQDFLVEAGAGSSAAPPPATTPPTTTQAPGTATQPTMGIDGSVATETDDERTEEYAERERQQNEAARNGEVRSGQQINDQLNNDTTANPTQTPKSGQGDVTNLNALGPNGRPIPSTADPNQIIGSADFMTMSADLFEEELLVRTDDFLRRRAGLWFTWQGRELRLGKLRTTLGTLIAGLEEHERDLEDSFKLTLPLPRGPQYQEIYEYSFFAEDYRLILQHLRLYKWMLDYRAAYTSAGRWSFLVPPHDTDADGTLMPAEYYPAKPFGTLTEGGAEQLGELKNALADLLQDLRDAHEAFNTSTRYDEGDLNVLLPRSFDRSGIESIGRAEMDRVVTVFLALSDASSKVYFDYASASPQGQVNFEQLLSDEAADVRAYLPPIDVTSREILAGAPAGEGDPTAALAGLFPATPWTALFPVEVKRIEGLILKDKLPLGGASIDLAGASSATTDRTTGMFSFANVTVHPWLGTLLTVTAPELEAPVTLVVRNDIVAWDVAIPLEHGVGGGAAAAVGADEEASANEATPSTLETMTDAAKSKKDELEGGKPVEGEDATPDEGEGEGDEATPDDGEGEGEGDEGGDAAPDEGDGDDTPPEEGDGEEGDGGADSDGETPGETPNTPPGGDGAGA